MGLEKVISLSASYTTKMPKKEDALQNREISWLQFNHRVLSETQKSRTPLFEKLRFLSIVHSNLDEFFMIRVGGLFDQKVISPMQVDTKMNWTVDKQLSEISKSVNVLYENIQEVYNDLNKSFRLQNIQPLTVAHISLSEKELLEESFDRDIFALCTAQIIDPKHPFPQFANKLVYVVLELERKGKKEVGLVSLNPMVSPSILVLPSSKILRYIQTEELAYIFADKLFKEWNVKSKALIRVTRNADINLEESDDLEMVDYRAAMKDLIKKRSRMAAIRLEYRYDIDDAIIQLIRKSLNIDKDFVFKLKSPLSYQFVSSLEENVRKLNLNVCFYDQKNSIKAFTNKDSVLETLQTRDLLVTTPFESFNTYIQFLNEASLDPKVFSISITLYRIASESRVLQALIQAAEAGKDVTVIFELKARFDESNNIEWSSRLEEAGIRVLYGVNWYKVHAKITLVKRKLNHKIQYFTHIGTGNYNEKTARLYTDFHLLTTNEQIGKDASNLFQSLMTNNIVEETQYQQLLVAPFSLQQKLLKHIEEEIELHQQFKNGYIAIKTNALTDIALIDALIKASQAGVKIDLIIRGISCIIPGVKGYTDNISVRSVVGRYLEHSRLFYFYANTEKKMFIASADWMTRNMLKRVEVATPVLDPLLKDKLLTLLEMYLQDTENTWMLDAKKNYLPVVALKNLDIHQELYVYSKGLVFTPALKHQKTSWLKRLFGN